MGNNNWPLVCLSEVTDIICGGTPSTGIQEYWNPAEIDWVTAKDISEASTAFLSSTERKISRMGLQESSTKIIPPFTSVIIARGATMGKCRLIKKEMAINQTCYGVVAKKDLNPKYLFYFLSSQYEHFQQIAHGSVFSTIIGSGLQKYLIPIPPKSIQNKIATILGSLDDKIDLNHRMNQTLEEIARTIFKSWFVDFDPVRAKAEGRDTGLPAEIAALFPDSFEPSPLGEIPRRWRVVRVDEVAGINEISITKEFQHTCIEYVDISSVDNGRLLSTSTKPGSSR